MAIFRNRLPSIQEIVPAFAACLFPLYSWAIFQFLDRVPAWIFYLNPWEIISMFAYTQLFALFESLLFLFALVCLAILAPNRFVRGKFVALASTGVLLSALWLVALQYNLQYNNKIEAFTLIEMPGWMVGVLYLLSITAAWGLIVRFEGIKRFVDSVADRLLVFLYIYLPISLVSIVIVLLRNLS